MFEGQLHIITGGLQDVFTIGEVVILKELCKDGIHIFKSNTKEAFLMPHETEIYNINN